MVYYNYREGTSVPVMGGTHLCEDIVQTVWRHAAVRRKYEYCICIKKL